MKKNPSVQDIKKAREVKSPRQLHKETAQMPGIPPRKIKKPKK